MVTCHFSHTDMYIVQNNSALSGVLVFNTRRRPKKKTSFFGLNNERDDRRSKKERCVHVIGLRCQWLRSTTNPCKHMSSIIDIALGSTLTDLWPRRSFLTFPMAEQRLQISLSNPLTSHQFTIRTRSLARIQFHLRCSITNNDVLIFKTVFANCYVGCRAPAPEKGCRFTYISPGRQKHLCTLFLYYFIHHQLKML